MDIPMLAKLFCFPEVETSVQIGSSSMRFNSYDLSAGSLTSFAFDGVVNNEGGKVIVSLTAAFGKLDDVENFSMLHTTEDKLALPGVVTLPNGTYNFPIQLVGLNTFKGTYKDETGFIILELRYIDAPVMAA
jgi:hypothetical protein